SRRRRSRTDAADNSTLGPGDIKSQCVGVYKRFHICNDQACPVGTKDFRQLQCESFNGKQFMGRVYLWEPFLDGKWTSKWFLPPKSREMNVKRWFVCREHVPARQRGTFSNIERYIFSQWRAGVWEETKKHVLRRSPSGGSLLTNSPRLQGQRPPELHRIDSRDLFK
ncbi:unnamed protein product, partial [Timema podura]|nr:unnamed protein product [Timema podura]